MMISVTTATDILNAIGDSIREDRTVRITADLCDVLDVARLIGYVDWSENPDGSAAVWGWCDDMPAPDDERDWRMIILQPNCGH